MHYIPYDTENVVSDTLSNMLRNVDARVCDVHIFNDGSYEPVISSEPTVVKTITDDSPFEPDGVSIAQIKQEEVVGMLLTILLYQLSGRGQLARSREPA